MKVYRVSLYRDDGSSAGFSWHPTKASARRAGAEWAENGSDYKHEVGVLNVPRSKAGLIAFLNAYASHEDNG